jgi:predicted RNase H-like HicB family nuclease
MIESQSELEYTYWKSKDGWFVGYLNIWPEHLTQGHSLAELEEMLADLYEFYKEEREVDIEKKVGKLKVIA